MILNTPVQWLTWHRSNLNQQKELPIPCLPGEQRGVCCEYFGENLPYFYCIELDNVPDSKVHVAIMGPIWGQQDPWPLTLAIRGVCNCLAMSVMAVQPNLQPPCQLGGITLWPHHMPWILLPFPVEKHWVLHYFFSMYYILYNVLLCAPYKCGINIGALINLMNYHSSNSLCLAIFTIFTTIFSKWCPGNYCIQCTWLLKKQNKHEVLLCHILILASTFSCS